MKTKPFALVTFIAVFAAAVIATLVGKAFAAEPPEPELKIRAACFADGHCVIKVDALLGLAKDHNAAVDRIRELEAELKKRAACVERKG